MDYKISDFKFHFKLGLTKIDSTINCIFVIDKGS